MKLPDMVHAWRFFNKMSVHETAEHIGIEDKVLRRFERGEAVSAPTLLAIMRWVLAE
jgi:ribosome-binding protein aMBF1 (putative translation factor)